MGSVFKRKGRKVYYITWIDQNGTRQEEKAFRDKGLSQRKLLKKEDEVERIKAGHLVPGEQERRLLLSECFVAYLADIKLRGLTDRYESDVRKQLERAQEECGWTTLGDVTAASLRKWLARLQAAGRGPRTLNLYRDAVGTFCVWAVQQGWLTENPVRTIPKARNPRGVKTKPRRAYTREEFTKLVTCKAIPEERRFIYRLAGLSGLRKNTLKLLEAQDCTPTGERPTWHVRPKIIKTGWKTPVPMLPECAEMLHHRWSSLSVGERLFKSWPRHQTFDKDLKRAGIKKLDGEGRCLDFHSFRYFFCTLMARALPIQKVRVLMMHRDARTTLNLYTDLGLIDVGEEVWTLPRLLAPPGPEKDHKVERAGAKKVDPPERRKGKKRSK